MISDNADQSRPTAEQAKASGRLDHRFKMLPYRPLLVGDEIGYLPVTQSGAVLFFQLINRRYGNTSTEICFLDLLNLDDLGVKS